MFGLVRWEFIVYDDYFWIILFWVEIIGIFFYLWTVKNIGGRFGYIDIMELFAGRLLIDVD